MGGVLAGFSCYSLWICMEQKPWSLSSGRDNRDGPWRTERSLLRGWVHKETKSPIWKWSISDSKQHNSHCSFQLSFPRKKGVEVWVFLPASCMGREDMLDIGLLQLKAEVSILLVSSWFCSGSSESIPASVTLSRSPQACWRLRNHFLHSKSVVVLWSVALPSKNLGSGHILPFSARTLCCCWGLLRCKVTLYMRRKNWAKD